MQSNLEAKYFECHVTLEPVFEERLAQLKTICRGHGFQVAELLMQRRANDTPDRSAKDSFCTGKAKSYGDMVSMMDDLTAELRLAGYKVWRRKIESVLYDERSSNV